MQELGKFFGERKRRNNYVQITHFFREKVLKSILFCQDAAKKLKKNYNTNTLHFDGGVYNTLFTFRYRNTLIDTSKVKNESMEL